MSSHRTLNDMFRAFDVFGPGRVQDPGSGGTINISMWGQVCGVTTAGAEARTLAAPTKPGILCAVVLDVYVGALTLTVNPASGTCYGYNADNDTTITFGSAGDFVVFYSIKIGTEYVWRVLAQEGTNAATEDMSVDQLTVATLTLGATALTATGAEINTACDQSVQRLTGGAGITGGTGTLLYSGVEQFGQFFKTTIFVDLTGLQSSTTDLDIIGQGASAAYLGRITAALNGTLFYGQVTCLETPATGVTDIDFYYATEATGVFDGGIAALEETVMLTKGGAWSAAPQTPVAFTGLPAANKYIYMTCGAAGTVGTYTAGQFLLELWGA